MSKFCTKCGKKLEDGETCSCRSNDVGAFEQKKEEIFQEDVFGAEEQERTMTKEAEWFEDKKNKVVSGTKNLFAEIMPILRKPVTTGRSLSLKNSSVLGFEFVIVKAVIAAIVVIVGLNNIGQFLVKTIYEVISAVASFTGELTSQDSYGYLSEYINTYMSEYMKLPYLKIILFILILTVGMDCLEALVLKIFTGLANGRTNYNAMITTVGIRALYEAIIFISIGIISIISVKVALIIGALMSLILPFIQYSIYQNSVQLDENKKVYTFFLVKVCIAIITYIIMYFMINSIIDSIVQSIYMNFSF